MYICYTHRWVVGSHLYAMQTVYRWSQRALLRTNFTFPPALVVSPVKDVFSCGLVSDMLQPDAVTVAAYVAHLITCEACAVGLELHDSVVQEDLVSADFCAPPALSIVIPLLLHCVCVYASLSLVSNQSEALCPWTCIELIKHVCCRICCELLLLNMRDQMGIPVHICGLPSVEVQPPASHFHLIAPEHDDEGWRPIANVYGSGKLRSSWKNDVNVRFCKIK